MPKLQNTSAEYLGAVGRKKQRQPNLKADAQVDFKDNV